MKNFFLYAAGVVTGIAIGGYVFKKRYEEIMEEDRQSRKEAYGREEEEEEEPKQASSVAPVNPDINEYKKAIAESGYSSDVENEEDPDYEIIQPMDFDTLEDYTSVTLTVYSDGVICDDGANPMSEDEIAAAIGGREPLDHFGEYEDNAVFVRNHARKVDYEILREEEDYE